MKRIILTLLALFLLAGCGVNTTFVYKPGAPVTDNPRLPVKVAVVAFQDGTENFTKRGNELFDQEKLVYNMAKAGWGGVMTALTPELWAKALADELTAAGSFGSARFVYNPAEAADDDIRIEGVVEKASLVGGFIETPNEFDLRLQAFRRTDAHPAWEKKISRKWVNQRKLYHGCGPTEIQCMVDRHHADTNRVMREMFVEASADLKGRLAASSGSRSETVERRPAQTQAPESVDETIEGILHGK
jgi:hypothetical protein